MGSKKTTKSNSKGKGKGKARSSGKKFEFTLSATHKVSLEDLVEHIGDGSTHTLKLECVAEGARRIIAADKIKEDAKKTAQIEKVCVC